MENSSSVGHLVFTTKSSLYVFDVVTFNVKDTHDIRPARPTSEKIQNRQTCSAEDDDSKGIIDSERTETMLKMHTFRNYLHPDPVIDVLKEHMSEGDVGKLHKETNLQNRTEHLFNMMWDGTITCSLLFHAICTTKQDGKIRKCLEELNCKLHFMDPNNAIRPTQGQTKSSVNRIIRCWITCLNLNMNIFTSAYIEHVRSSTRDEDLVRLAKRIDGRSSTEEKELCMLPYINSYERFQELSNILEGSAKQQYLSSNNLRRFRHRYVVTLMFQPPAVLLLSVGEFHKRVATAGDVISKDMYKLSQHLQCPVRKMDVDVYEKNVKFEVVCRSNLLLDIKSRIIEAICLYFREIKNTYLTYDVEIRSLGEGDKMIF